MNDVPPLSLRNWWHRDSRRYYNRQLRDRRGACNLSNGVGMRCRDDERLVHGVTVAWLSIMPDTFSLAMYPVPGIPLASGGEDVGEIIVERKRGRLREILDRDVVVIAQKLVSKAEHRVYKLNDFDPSPEALILADRPAGTREWCGSIFAGKR